MSVAASNRHGAEPAAVKQKQPPVRQAFENPPNTRCIDFVFFDSGTGGIPYMLYLKQKSPHSSCVYVADTKNFPYGEKSGGEIVRGASDAVHLILRRFAPRAFVVACNTLSVTALEQLRAAFPAVPFVGTVPAIKQAAAVSKNRRIGLLATQRTVDEPYTAELAQRFASDCTLIKRADPALIEFIEHDFFSATDADKKAAVKPAVNFFLENGSDTIILGCTHFLHIADVIAQEAGKDVQVVDSKEGVVNQALRVAGPSSAAHLKASAESTANAAGQSSAGAAGFNANTAGTAGCTFFISGPEGIDEVPYKVLSKKLGIPYGGILSGA